MARTSTAQPIASINVTPLIDVLLVLLIMMIITIPMATHKVTIDLPQSPPVPQTVIPKTHELAIAANGALTLDGAAIDETALPDQLAMIGGEKESSLMLRADPAARYAVFDRVVATVKRAGITKLGFPNAQQFAKAF